MNTINNEKIKTYNECNVDEKKLLDTFRAMKLNYDQARFELYSYRINDLIEKYENIVEMRRDAQASFFEIMKEIDKDGLSAIDVSYEKFVCNRQLEENYTTEELNIVQEYKVGFEEALDIIYSGVAEQLLIQEENNW